MNTTPTPPQDRDAAWLEALAGRPAPSLDDADRLEVQQLRRVMERHKAQIAPEAGEATEDDFQRMWTHLMHEQPRPAEGERGGAGSLFIEADSLRAKDDRKLPANRPSFSWSMAASLLVVASIASFVALDEEDQEPVFKGQGVATIITTDAPLLTSASIRKDLMSAGVTIENYSESSDNVSFELIATPEVLDLLVKYNIYPTIFDQRILINIRKNQIKK